MKNTSACRTFFVMCIQNSKYHSPWPAVYWLKFVLFTTLHFLYITNTINPTIFIIRRWPVTPCFLPACKGKGGLKTFWREAINRLMQSSKERGNAIHTKFEITNDDTNDNTVMLHKNCYCSYTSKSNITKYLSKKRKDSSFSTDSSETPIRVRRSQLPSFEFKKHCSICGKECVPKDSKHPDRWDRVIQCETGNRPSLPWFKDYLLDVCEQRSDEWGRQVEIRIRGVHTDLPAADAQYHQNCYRQFMKTPKYMDILTDSDSIDYDALKSVIDETYAKQMVCGWTSIELSDMYSSYGGQLTSNQMFSKLVNYFGDDIVIVRMTECASILGFKHFMSKSLKLVRVDSTDEDNVDTIVRQIRSEVQNTACHNAVNLLDSPPSHPHTFSLHCCTWRNH